MTLAKLQSLLQSAVAHHRAGRLNEAELVYRQLRTGAPRQFDVLHLSGLLAYQQGRVAEAVDFLGRAHALNRTSAECEMRLALALLAMKRTAEAEAHLRQVVKTQPDSFEAWDHLAHCLKTQDRLEEAVACHAKAVALKPDYARGWYNYGLTLSLCGRIAEALSCHERALAADPKYALGRFGRAQALHQSDRIAEAVEDYGTFLALEPKHHEARSYRLLALHNLESVSREALFAEHVTFGRMVGPAPEVKLPNRPEPARRLRVGILSPDFRLHSCAYFLEPILQHLDRSQFELCLYHDHFREDEVTERLRRLATVWRNFVGQPGPTVEKVIRGDAPDILIDLAGHTGMTNRLPLFARRLAPVQLTYLGYPDTTGVPAMDYRFTDGVADPAGEADRFATEKLVRFAPTAWSYTPPRDAPLPALPAGPRDGVVFGCFNSPSKITDTTLTLWARILGEVSGSRLRLKGRGLSTAAVQAAYRERFGRVGLPAERVELRDWTADTKSHLTLYHDVDLTLDTFPYHGTTTTCEALWMGVPVISLAGDTHRSRVGASLLTAVGRPEWIAPTPDEYVRLAVELARDSGRITAERAGLRAAMQQSPLLDHAGQAARFGAALRACWTTWCEAVRPENR